MDQERKLASVRLISNIIPANNSDNLEIAIVDNWQCVARKGSFSVGEKIIFFETDAFLPIESKYEFLRKCCFKTMELPNGGKIDGFRLRTMKLRGNISQGLVMKYDLYDLGDLPVGEDVSSRLNVVKYEKPVPANLRAANMSRFPEFIPKTYAERIQNIDESAANLVYIPTEKIDGTSVTYFNYNIGNGICSRNYQLPPDGDTVYHKFEPENIPYKYAIQGEIFGSGINKNKLGVEQQFIVFNVFRIDYGYYLDTFMAKEFCEDLGINFVPILGRFPSKLSTDHEFVQDLLTRVDGLESVVAPGKLAEGIVFQNPNIKIKVLSRAYEMER